jgi:hypothetical protein
MKELIVWVAGLYSVSLIGFLVYLRKGFFQMSGEDALPSINFDSEEDIVESE